MSSSQRRNSNVSKGVPPRPDDTVYATGGEGCESPGEFSRDDGPGSNPTLGNHVPDGPGDEGRSISLRQVTTCATRNIRGMIQGKLNVITHEMNRCGVSILGVSEHWMLSQGRFTTDDGFGVYFSGKEEGWGASGVDFVVDKEASKAVLGYNPIDDRVMTLRLKGHPINTTFLQVYAPTTEADEDKMDVFYSKVQEALRQDKQQRCHHHRLESEDRRKQTQYRKVWPWNDK